MLVPLKWLHEYVDIDVSAQELAHLLTMHALEVESVSEPGKGITEVYIGKITRIEPHPNADKLVVCQVIFQENETPVQIVTGASNVFEGAVIPVARVGAHLPVGIDIRSAKLRGVESEGMLCSEKELGLSEEASGIMILPKVAPLGENIVTYLGLDDAVLDVSILPNRGDCLSLIGIAREVSAITGKELRLPRMDIDRKDLCADTYDVSVTVKDPDLCPRYTARIVDGITIKPSPDWMQQYLQRAGIRPINNIVDITNYVLLEMGQPLHAFDYHTLAGHSIVVRRAQQGETIETLDEKVRTLTDDMLVICDSERAIAVAGIMGGAATEIAEGTTTVLIESAYFNPTSIRRTGMKLGLRSESSARFEKSVDFDGVVNALNRAAQLMVLYGGGKVCEKYVDVKDTGSVLNEPVTVKIDPVRVQSILGLAIGLDEVKAIVTSLGFQYRDMSVVVPSWRRTDVTRLEDLVEEIARIKGYQHIPVTVPSRYVPFTGQNEIDTLNAIARESLIGDGMSEIVSFSITSPDEFDRLRLPQDSLLRKHFAITNPLSIDESVMRTQMISSLLHAVANNTKRQQQNCRLFEVGRVFLRTDEIPVEKNLIAGAMTGRVHSGVINATERKQDTVDFFTAKGVAENLLDALGVKNYNIETYEAPFYQPGRSAAVKVGQNIIGSVARIHPDVAGAYDIDTDVYYFELVLDDLLAYANRKKQYVPVPVYPSTRRDTTLWVRESVTAREVGNVIRKAGGKLLADYELIDRYSGENIHGPDFYNLTYALYFQSLERTLTDEEVNAAFNGIIQALTGKVGARFG